MKSFGLILFLVLVTSLGASLALAENPPPGVVPSGSGGLETLGRQPLTVGEPYDTVGEAAQVVQLKDLNGDVVWKIVVTCTVLTDGAQECERCEWIMGSTPGTLTLDNCIPGP